MEFRPYGPKSLPARANRGRDCDCWKGPAPRHALGLSRKTGWYRKWVVTPSRAEGGLCGQELSPRPAGSPKTHARLIKQYQKYQEKQYLLGDARHAAFEQTTSPCEVEEPR